MRVFGLLAFTAVLPIIALSPRLPRFKLLKQVKVNDKWTLATALFDSNGRVRRDHALSDATWVASSIWSAHQCCLTRSEVTIPTACTSCQFGDGFGEAFVDSAFHGEYTPATM